MSWRPDQDPSPLHHRRHRCGSGCTTPPAPPDSGHPLASSCIAAELLVLADQIVPETPEASGDVLEGLGLDGMVAKAIEWERWSVRQQIRQELAAEARKANQW